MLCNTIGWYWLCNTIGWYWFQTAPAGKEHDFA